MTIKFDVRITLSAERDIADIWSFIAEDSPGEATQFILKLERQMTTLERFPLRCPLIPENDVLGTGYRHFLFGKYRALFRVGEKVVYVLRVIHGSRLLDSTMLETY